MASDTKNGPRQAQTGSPPSRSGRFSAIHRPMVAAPGGPSSKSSFPVRAHCTAMPEPSTSPTTGATTARMRFHEATARSDVGAGRCLRSMLIFPCRGRGTERFARRVRVVGRRMAGLDMGLGAASTGTGSGRTPGVTLVVLPGMGSRTSALASTYTMKADSDAIAGAYSLVEEEFWADTTPLHVQVGAEEAFYVLSGRVAAWASESETVLEAGTFLLVPRGTPHALRRVDPPPVRMLTLI